MEHALIAKQFAMRLRESMISSGFASSSTVSGVNLSKLSEITGCSMQICRKYVQGNAMPGYSKLIKLAKSLNVSPGWLTFGDEISHSREQEPLISIKEESLHYILKEASHLREHLNKIDYADYLITLIKSVVSLDCSVDLTSKVINLIVTLISNSKVNKCT